MMRNRFDEQLNELNSEMIRMGALCEEVIALAAKALDVQNKGYGLWQVALDLGEAAADPVTDCQNVHAGDLVAYDIKKNAILSLDDLRAKQEEFPHCISDGILILNEDCKPGDDMAVILGRDDHIVEFEITPNRPDCLCVIGLAREAAVTFGKELKLHEPVVKGGGPGVLTELLDVETPAADLVPRYTARMVRNETNHITLYRKKGNTTVEEVRFSIRYVAQKADEDHPTIGEHPPTIVTNLDGVTETSNRNFTLTVKATAYTGSPLYASQIEVQMDGKRITGPTGGPVYEYQLYFPDPIVGDTVEHTITIRAWDGEGNSAFVSYHILYRFVDTGDPTVIVDDFDNETMHYDDPAQQEE